MDGCVALFWNKVVCCDFVRGYLDCPKSQNKLDMAMYVTMRCNHFTALTRVHAHSWYYICAYH